MSVRIVALDDHDEVAAEELASIFDWLRRERIPTLRVQPEHAAVADGEMGAGLDALTLIASGGTGAAVVASIDAWLRTRRPSVRLKVSDERGDREIELSGIRPSQADDVLERFLDTTLTSQEPGAPA